MGAIILLYRQLLVVTAERQLADKSWSLNLSVDDAKRYKNECALAGQQVARLLRLISFDGTLTKRCWIIMLVSTVVFHTLKNY